MDFHSELFKRFVALELPLWVEYHVSHIFPQETGINDFTRIPLNDEREVVVERRMANLPIELDGEKREFFLNLLNQDVQYKESEDSKIQQIMTYEFIPEGLGDYY